MLAGWVDLGSDPVKNWTSFGSCRMRTALLIVAAATILSPAAATTASANPVVSRIQVKPVNVDLGEGVLAMARLTAHLETPVVPPALVDSMVRFRTASRDLVFGALDH